MNIAVDLRCLTGAQTSFQVSGVENYALNLLEALLDLDKKNNYILFSNRFSAGGPEANLRFINTRLAPRRIPNKILNLALRLKFLTLEKLIQEPVDVFFMPNPAPFNLLPQTKVVLTVHDLSPITNPEFYDFKRRLWHSFLNFPSAFRRADKILAVSEWTKNDLTSILKVPKEKIAVSYPGVDLVKFSEEKNSPDLLRKTRNIYRLPGEYLLFLNTVEPRKNLTNLVAAFERLNWPGYLVVAGRKGWKYRKIFSRIKKSPKAKKIIYLGYVPEKHKPALIKLSRALVYPSIYEGFGFQPLEAAASGVPVVASQVSALPETAGKWALLVDPYNPALLASAITNILTDRLLRETLIKNGLKAAENYRWENTARDALKAFESVAERGGHV